MEMVLYYKDCSADHLLIIYPENRFLVIRIEQIFYLLMMKQQHLLVQLQPLNMDETLDENTDKEMVMYIIPIYYYLMDHFYLDLSKMNAIIYI
jgi:hypothetical protein